MRCKKGATNQRKREVRFGETVGRKAVKSRGHEVVYVHLRLDSSTCGKKGELLDLFSRKTAAHLYQTEGCVVHFSARAQ